MDSAVLLVVLAVVRGAFAVAGRGGTIPVTMSEALVAIAAMRSFANAVREAWKGLLCSGPRSMGLCFQCPRWWTVVHGSRPRAAGRDTIGWRRVAAVGGMRLGQMASGGRQRLVGAVVAAQHFRRRRGWGKAETAVERVR
jgi:hypothetical protein